MLFICYPKCTTCKRAQAYLDGMGVDYEIRDIKENNPTYAELKSWLAASELPIKRFFNTSGLLYKELGLKNKLPSMNEEECLNLLATDGMLVKRPILVDDDFVLVGFKQDEWETALAPVEREIFEQRMDDEAKIKEASFRRDYYRGFLWQADEAAKILSDTTFIQEYRGDVLVSGYKRSLDSHQNALASKLSKVFSPLDDWMKKKRKAVGRNNFKGDAYRLAECEWWKNTADEIRRMVDEETSVEFWLKQPYI